ncbi:cache domain-containing protein [Duganella violaceipulchra]|uniref:Cache domain-containing protein n=1 Tax=Duganella violaceipulchra TaxID=2849652 RepID=A0AA41L1H7_9BURK|nr:cache domain-containing protein [Duganella violaceicalia]MBV6324821.1 cache domain-containing protein [Duganella violaceicalia]MCP2012145.1 signal transduction histidine kinase [Duganella violaceicalia]
MKHLFQFLFAAALTLSLTGAATAQDAPKRGTADEAVAMVKRAGEYLQKNGKDKAVAAFNDPKGDFIQGDLYVFMFDKAGVALAHGQNPKMVNKNLMELSAGGVYPIKEFLKIGASPAGKGWVQYMWPNSISKNLEEKNTYVEKVGEYVIGVGIYK